jgi:hypothetical protein
MAHLCISFLKCRWYVYRRVAILVYVDRAGQLLFKQVVFFLIFRGGTNNESIWWDKKISIFGTNTTTRGTNN